MPIAPSIKYPYGMEKIKNVVVIIPAALFLFFGGQILYENAINLLFYNTAVIHHSGNESFVSTLLYLASITVETLIIRKNVLDAITQAESDEKMEYVPNNNSAVNLDQNS
jgi:solute carrier family 30 (zinc transporter), member 9